MDNLLDIALLIVGVFTTMSALLYVLASIDPQTDRGSGQPQEASSPQPQLSSAA